MAATKTSPAIRAAKSRGIDDAVNGRPCEPGAVMTEEVHAYCKGYVEYFGEESKRAYQLLDIMATSHVFAGAPFRTPVAQAYEQLSLFGGVDDDAHQSNR